MRAQFPELLLPKMVNRMAMGREKISSIRPGNGILRTRRSGGDWEAGILRNRRVRPVYENRLPY